MIYPCILCVSLLMDMFVLGVACLTVFVNCLVKQFVLVGETISNMFGCGLLDKFVGFVVICSHAVCLLW